MLQATGRKLQLESCSLHPEVVDFLTIGQYLRPTAWNLEVKEYVPPQQYEWYRTKGLELGFKYVASGPYVRSSYKAGELFIKNIIHGNH